MLGAAAATALTIAAMSGAMAFVTAKRLGIVSFVTIPWPGGRVASAPPVTDS